jgi:ribosomal protein S18 acetylase RimI-like enzyme
LFLLVSDHERCRPVLLDCTAYSLVSRTWTLFSPSTLEDSMPLPSSLGPDCVGLRVVVRRVLRGSVGPSGGPAMTDVLGVMESWADGVTRIRSDSGPVAVQIVDIVSGKPVPPRPSVASRLSADLVERRALSSWPAAEVEALGDWVLRASGGYSARANSVLAVGSPQPLDPVVAFYADRGLPAWAQVVVGSPVVALFEEAGWRDARPGDADSLFQVASVARAMRAAGPPSPETAFAPTAWPGTTDAARAIMEGPEQVGFLSIGEHARGRVAVTTHGVDVWAAVTDVWVSPRSRGQGLGRVVMAALLDWAAERGAGTAYLQVRGDNPAALALYAGLGFVTHHSYRYLAAP